LESKNLNPTKGFEHVKGYVGFAVGKPRVCSEPIEPRKNYAKNECGVATTQKDAEK